MTTVVEQTAVALLRQSLAESGGSARMRVRGGCMEPLIRDGDLALLGAIDGLPPVGAVVVAETAATGVVCHRVTRRRGGVVVIRGDRSGSVDAVGEDAIVGVVTGVARGGRRIALLGPVNALYAAVQAIQGRLADRGHRAAVRWPAALAVRCLRLLSSLWWAASRRL
jgi:hypothetical protein